MRGNRAFADQSIIGTISRLVYCVCSPGRTAEERLMSRLRICLTTSRCSALTFYWPMVSRYERNKRSFSSGHKQDGWSVVKMLDNNNKGVLKATDSLWWGVFEGSRVKDKKVECLTLSEWFLRQFRILLAGTETYFTMVNRGC